MRICMLKPKLKDFTLYKPPVLVHLGHQFDLVFPMGQTNISHLNYVLSLPAVFFLLHEVSL